MEQLVHALQQHLAYLAGRPLVEPLLDLLRSYPQPLVDTMAASCAQGGIVGLFSSYLHQVSQVRTGCSQHIALIVCLSHWQLMCTRL